MLSPMEANSRLEFRVPGRARAIFEWVDGVSISMFSPVLSAAAPSK